MGEGQGKQIDTQIGHSDTEISIHSVPVAGPRRSQRSTPGVHRNLYFEPRSSCNAVALSLEVVSQLLTSLGTGFFREAVKEVKDRC